MLERHERREPFGAAADEPRPEVERAIRVALEEHAGQIRKASGLPYVVHPIEVAKRLSDLGLNDQASLCAAVLHDVLEDGSETREGIEEQFGAKVAGIVAELTFDEASGSKSEYVASFRDRSVEALVIKLVDRACNVDDFVRSRPDYAPKYAAKADALYRACDDRHSEIAEAYGEHFAARLAAEVARLSALASH